MGTVAKATGRECEPGAMSCKHNYRRPAQHRPAPLV